MYFPKPSLNENDMAIIERGDTAAHSIEAGQYVSWHGKTGKAKAAILQGTTLDDTLFDYSENGAINELNASLTKIIFGSKQLSSIPASSNSEQTISFGKTFNSPPLVFTQVVGALSAGEVVMGGVCNITTTSFNIRLRNGVSHVSIDPVLNWIAYGE